MTVSRTITLDMGQWWVERHIGANTSTVASGTYTMDSQVVRPGLLVAFSMGGYAVNSIEIRHGHMAVNTSVRPDANVLVDGLIRVQIKNEHTGANTITGWATVVLRKPPK